MRSSWKIRNYIKHGYSSVTDIDAKLFTRRGFLNPLFYEKRILIYRGNIFKNFKIREEMIVKPIQSFIITRPPFSSIRMKFGSSNLKSSKKR